MVFRTTLAAFAILIFVPCALAQSLSQEFPGTILGYRLHRAELSLAVRAKNEPLPEGHYDLLITVGQPRVASVGITEARAEVTGEIESFRHEGEIHFVRFRDFTVNGMPIEIPEFTEKISLRRQRPFKFTKPLTVRMGALTMVKAAATDVLRTPPRMQVNGTLLVFGRFKRFGKGFKRVVPVTVAFSIENPLVD